MFVVDGVMATNYFSCQPLPSGTAPGIVTALKRAMAHADVDLDVWIRKLFFYCGDGASVVQGECGGIIRIVGDLQKEIARYDVVVPYHASCHRCELAFKAASAPTMRFLICLLTRCSPLRCFGVMLLLGSRHCMHWPNFSISLWVQTVHKLSKVLAINLSISLFEFQC